MEQNELEGRVQRIIAETLSVSQDQVTRVARYKEDLSADSLDLVEAVLALEEEFGISIPEEEMEDVKTVGETIDLVAQKVGAAS